MSKPENLNLNHSRDFDLIDFNWEEETLGVFYLGKKEDILLLEPIALVVIKSVISIYSYRLSHQKLDYDSFKGSKNLVWLNSDNLAKLYFNRYSDFRTSIDKRMNMQS